MPVLQRPSYTSVVYAEPGYHRNVDSEFEKPSMQRPGEPVMHGNDFRDLAIACKVATICE